jgi:peptide/nickel transport system ATP-binding protein
MDRAAARSEAARLLELVQLPQRTADCFPGQLSGGERQRVSIARALAAQPKLLVCDEITSALDVSVQAAVVNLLERLQRDLALAVIFVSHDLALVASIADHVAVLNKGRVCEFGDAHQIIAHPADQYTRDLLAAVPRLITPPTTGIATDSPIARLGEDTATEEA